MISEEIHDDLLVLLLWQIWWQIPNEQGHVGAVRVFLQLQVEPGQLHEPDRFVTATFQHVPRNVFFAKNRLSDCSEGKKPPEKWCKIGLSRKKSYIYGYSKTKIYITR